MAVEFEKDDYFKIDPEPHLIGDMERVNHFPAARVRQITKMFFDSSARKTRHGIPPEATAALVAR